MVLTLVRPQPSTAVILTVMDVVLGAAGLRCSVSVCAPAAHAPLHFASTFEPFVTAMVTVERSLNLKRTLTVLAFVRPAASDAQSGFGADVEQRRRGGRIHRR